MKNKYSLLRKCKTFKIKIIENKYKNENAFTLKRPTVTNSSETWILTEKDDMQLRIFARQILQKIFGPIKIGKDIRRIRNNIELDHVTSGEDIVRFVKAQRIK
jgi:hypothetical protein